MPGSALTVQPLSALQGDAVTLSGQGWQPRAAIVLSFIPANGPAGNTISLGRTMSDDQGNFVFVTVVPRLATPGAWSITARTDPEGASATATFTVLATDVTATALSFETPSSEPVTDYTATPEPQPTAAPATATPLPPAATAAATPTSIPTAQPQMTMAATVQGNRLSLLGGGWPAGQRVTISVSREKDGRSALQLGVVTADASGRIAFSARLPREAQNAPYVVAAGGSLIVIMRLVKTGG